MRRLRVILMVHAELVPPASTEGLSEEEVHTFKAEYDVLTTLGDLGHEVRVVGMVDDFAELRATVAEFKPHIVFNLLTHFHEAGIYDSAVVGWLELNKLAYTGCNPRGLLVANDKALAKKVFSYHRIRAPRFFVVPKGRAARRLPSRLEYPLIVKSGSEHASTGISQASIVRDREHLEERVQFIHRNVNTAAICEEYIEGRELTIGVLGNARLETGPVWELSMDKLPEGAPNIVTSRVKWNLEYQRRIGLETFPAEDLKGERGEEFSKLARRIYRALGLTGYARMDMRLDASGRIWVLEANPNPDLCFGEDFAESFEQRGYDYPKLLQKLLNLGLRYEPPWKA